MSVKMSRELKRFAAIAASSGPRWFDLEGALESIVKNPEPTRATVALRYASVITGLNGQELDLLIQAMRDNSEWLMRARRGTGLGIACGNAKVRAVLRKLFVLEQPTGLTFVTGAEVIEAAAENIGGMQWDRSNTVTRVRRNKVMNWGMANTRYSVLTEHEIKEPVVLVPEDGTEKKAVFFVSPKLIKAVQSFENKWHALRIDSRIVLPFWFDLFGLCNAILSNAEEHECFTYGPRVRCDVSLLDKNRLRGSGNRTGKARRRAVTTTQEV